MEDNLCSEYLLLILKIEGHTVLPLSLSLCAFACISIKTSPFLWRQSRSFRVDCHSLSVV
jgi:hypothetical protein